MTIKILNLYAGIGGNRKLWPNDKIEVTAVEIDRKIAEKYKSLFPNDYVVVGDAHDYLLKHYKEFDFIWSSPPCQTHSVTNWFLNPQGIIRYPDMSLYQEILFLQNWFKGLWVVENVQGYYEPLVKAQICGRHYFWANFKIPNKDFGVDIGTVNRNAYLIAQNRVKKNQLERNAVNPELGLHIFKMAFKEKQQTLRMNVKKKWGEI